MRTYIKKFNTYEEYSAFVNSSGFVTPNVSTYEIESGETEVRFNKTKPDIEITHEYVDLGLPSGTLWATENIKDENGNDLYFAWGEAQGYTSGQVGTVKNFSFEDYEFGTSDNLTKYNSTDGKTALDSEDDAAAANWGSGWKMPTKEQFEELTANTTTAWTQVNGVNGVLFTSKVNNNTLFFPAVGEATEGNIGNIGDFSFYMSVSLSDYDIKFSYVLFIISGFCEITDSDSGRQFGDPVRPVKAQD